MYCYSISELTKEIVEKVIPNSSIGVYDYFDIKGIFYPIELYDNEIGAFEVATFFGNISNNFPWSNFLKECTNSKSTLILAIPSIMKDSNGEEFFLGEFLEEELNDREHDINSTNAIDIPINHFFKDKKEIPVEFVLGFCSYSDENGFEFVTNKNYIGFKSQKEQAEFFDSIKDSCIGLKPLNEKTKLDLDYEDYFSSVAPSFNLYKEQLKRKLKDQPIESYKSQKVQKELTLIMQKAEDKLVNNPAFLTHFEYACRQISKSIGIENFKVEMHDNGKKVCVYALSEETDSIKSRCFDSFVFSLEGDSLVVDRATSMAYDTASKEFRETEIYDSKDTKTVLDVNYSQVIYDSNGIELSHSNISNVEFIKSHIPYDELDLVSLTLSKKYKSDMIIDSLPGIPEGLEENYEIENAYRTYDNLGIAYCQTAFQSKGISKNSNEVFVLNSDYPERLIVKFNGPIAIWNDELEDYEVSDYKSFGHLSFDELYEIYKEYFIDSLEESKTKLENSNMYNTILSVTNNTNQKRKKKVEK